MSLGKLFEITTYNTKLTDEINKDWKSVHNYTINVSLKSENSIGKRKNLYHRPHSVTVRQNSM